MADESVAWDGGALPQQLTGFIGRETELGQVAGVLAEHRLVTMTGAGGCGKTRLALEVASRTASAFRDGVWWVDLAGVANSDLVGSAAAAAFPLARRAMPDPTGELVDELRHRCALVVLDNCEQVADGCARLTDALLRACPRMTVLCTSRQPLDVDGEVMWRVSPLSVPGPELFDPEEVGRSEAVQLFVERAGRRRFGFALDGVSAPAVAAICRRLDGLPLAVELAAAWMSSMTPEQIDRAVSRHLLPLVAGGAGRPPRHQTLEASLDWSHQHLLPDEQVVFRRLSVFSGSFTVDAAQRVCGVDDVLPSLSRLVDRSLVDLVETLGGRYRLLQTVRRFAGQKLERAGEGDDVRHRHLDLCLAVAQGIGPLQGPDAQQSVDLLEAQRDDMLATMEWARRSGRIDDARTLAADLLAFWMVHYPAEGLARLEAVLDEETGAPLPRARAHSAAAWLALYGPFDAERALRYARKALVIARPLAPADVTAVSLNHFAWAAIYADAEEAGPAFREAVTLHERHGDLPQLAHALAGLGFVAVQEGDGEAAERLLAESLDTARRAGDEIGVRRALAFLGSVRALHGDLSGAEKLLDECLDRARRLRDHYFIAHALDYLALVAIYRGALGPAGELLTEAMISARRSSPMALARTLVQTAQWAFVAGDLQATRTSLSAVPPGAWGVTWYLARRLPLLAEASIVDHDLETGGRHVDDALAAARQPERPWAQGLAGLAEARLRRAQGALPQATSAAHEALRVFVRSGHRPDAIDALELLAQLRHDGGHHREAVRLLGAADAARDGSGLCRPPVYELDVRSLRRSLGDALGPAADALIAAGGRLSLGEALAYVSRGRGERRRPPAGWESLTGAEHRVARLVAGGLSNAEIAQRLFISPGTVRAHLGHIYSKLGLRSRAQLATEVTRRGVGA